MCHLVAGLINTVGRQEMEHPVMLYVLDILTTYTYTSSCNQGSKRRPFSRVLGFEFSQSQTKKWDRSKVKCALLPPG